MRTVFEIDEKYVLYPLTHSLAANKMVMMMMISKTEGNPRKVAPRKRATDPFLSDVDTIPSLNRVSTRND